MTTSFANASDDQIIALVKKASRRLVVIGPAFSVALAKALAARIEDLPALSFSSILDAAPAVHPIGYNEFAFRLLRHGEAASGQTSFNLVGDGS
jgi:hypothetical protein